MARKPVIHGRDHAPGGADPIPAAGGGVGTFAASNGSFTPTSPPEPYDDLDYFATTDSASFDFDNGVVRILQPGFYVIVMYAQAEISGSPITDQTFWIWVQFDEINGGGIEGTGDSFPMTRVDFPAGTPDDWEVGMQRMHPVSITSDATFPVPILPMVDLTAVGDGFFNQVSLWGYRLSGPLNPDISD